MARWSTASSAKDGTVQFSRPVGCEQQAGHMYRWVWRTNPVVLLHAACWVGRQGDADQLNSAVE
jgi:hypothetical protein